MNTKYISTLAMVLFMCIVTSCGSSEKKITTADGTVVTEAKNEQITDMDYAEQGFLRGVVYAGKEEGSCSFVVEILGGIVAQKVDPVDMPESFKKDQQKVWIKFGGLRQKNRCPEAQPVTIKDIKERAK